MAKGQHTRRQDVQHILCFDFTAGYHQNLLDQSQTKSVSFLFMRTVCLIKFVENMFFVYFSEKTCKNLPFCAKKSCFYAMINCRLSLNTDCFCRFTVALTHPPSRSFLKKARNDCYLLICITTVPADSRPRNNR